MYLFLSFLMSLAGIQIYFVFLWLGVYRRYPIETYALMLLGTLLAFWAARQKKSFWRFALAFMNGFLLIFILAWTLHYSRLPDRIIPFRAGQAFPSITLADQDERPFASDDLKGKTAVLYIFYRGDW